MTDYQSSWFPLTFSGVCFGKAPRGGLSNDRRDSLQLSLYAYVFLCDFFFFALIAARCLVPEPPDWRDGKSEKADRRKR